VGATQCIRTKWTAPDATRSVLLGTVCVPGVVGVASIASRSITARTNVELLPQGVNAPS